MLMRYGNEKKRLVKLNELYMLNIKRKRIIFQNVREIIVRERVVFVEIFNKMKCEELLIDLVIRY